MYVSDANISEANSLDDPGESAGGKLKSISVALGRMAHSALDFVARRGKRRPLFR